MSENDGGKGNTEIGSLAVAIVALVVALVALLGTTAQVFQQYLATAVGYSNCGKRVMGPWARHTKLVFHPWELRFEVVFQSPYITVKALLPSEAGNIDMESWDVEEPSLNRRVELHDKKVIADYSATWLVLLSTARSMLRESVPSSGSQTAMITVEVQPRLQTLDLMPEGVKKPYATTTLGSIVILAGLLGLHWKQFDRTNDRYVADGNGLLFTGFSVPHLGIMFTFTRHDTPRFPPITRVILTDGLLEYCFGLVPTVFRPSYFSQPRYLIDIPPDLGTLRLGSPAEITSTMELLQCDRGIIEAIGSIEHIFPVLFELIGMFGRPMHIRGVASCMLPNPLPYRWDDKRFSPKRLLDTCADEIQGLAESILVDEAELVGLVASLQASSSTAQFPFGGFPGPSLGLLGKLHDVVDWCDNRLRFQDDGSQRETLMIVRIHIDMFWGALLKSRQWATGPPVGLFELHSFLRASNNNINPEDRESGLVKMYFDAICRGKPLWVDALRNSSRDVWDRHPGDKSGVIVVWLVLILRMVCWLNLHTFHAADVQLPKSDLMGTRLPVYIS